MAFLDDEFIKILKGFGYRIRIEGNYIKIRNRSSPSNILSALFIIIGFLFIFNSFGEYRIALLGLMMVAVAFINFGRNQTKSVVIDTARASIQYRAGFFSKKQTRLLSDIKEFAVYSYDRSSHTSAFEEGNRDYFIDLCIQWNNKEEFELFHFKRRSQKELVFVEPLVEQLDDFIKQSSNKGGKGLEERIVNK